jgi:hypothetical protein
MPDAPHQAHEGRLDTNQLKIFQVFLRPYFHFAYKSVGLIISKSVHDMSHAVEELRKHQ